ALFYDVLKALFDPYRPELHYMRGPGPRWRAKHASSPPSDSAVAHTPLPTRAPIPIAVPVLIRGSGAAGRGFVPGGLLFATSLRSKCDLIAAILNPNRRFSATPAHKSEIASEFALVFNKFAGTIACKGALQAMGNGANGEPARVVPDGDHGKNNSRQ